MPIRSVFFDVGETIVDESREYGTWADWLGVPRHTFSAVFGAVIARGLDYRETFQVFRPGFVLGVERERRAAAGRPEPFGEENLYPDARLCLAALRKQGLRVGLAGNQTARAEVILRALDLPVDVLGTSDGWGMEKPSVAFFDRVLAGRGGLSCRAGALRWVPARQRHPAGAGRWSGDRAGTPRAVGTHPRRSVRVRPLPVPCRLPG